MADIFKISENALFTTTKPNGSHQQDCVIAVHERLAVSNFSDHLTFQPGTEHTLYNLIDPSIEIKVVVEGTTPDKQIIHFKTCDDKEFPYFLRSAVPSGTKKPYNLLGIHQEKRIPQWSVGDILRRAVGEILVGSPAGSPGSAVIDKSGYLMGMIIKSENNEVLIASTVLIYGLLPTGDPDPDRVSF
ncbi:hypothetical protein CRE_27214 [Caenorhabditis remanei]|uniref:Peptidase S1 domain-containing protein n=1 Tax=Caenorhabditis remanei TaxID=31234 RepID=E3LP40_CAERE|nr:hypothetical protein CRE_27214 [Caenorhabditis remanei]